MRQYRESVLETNQLEKIICNKCGREIPKSDEIWLEDVLQVEKEWGYFSKKDGRRDHFDICEDCYDEWISSFAVPMESVEKIV